MVKRPLNKTFVQSLLQQLLLHTLIIAAAMQAASLALPRGVVLPKDTFKIWTRGTEDRTANLRISR